MLLAAATVALDLAHPLKGGGAWAWPIAFAVHALMLRLAAPAWPGPVARAVHACGLLALALLVFGSRALKKPMEKGWNWYAMIALFFAVAPVVPGFIRAATTPKAPSSR